MASNHPLHASPRNFMLSGFALANPLGINDALENCANSLYLLADLFGHDPKAGGYWVLRSESARYGLFLHLTGIADLLKAASKVATVEMDQQVFGEIELAFGEHEWQRLRATAERSGKTVEDYVSVLLREWLERYGVPESPKN